MKFFYYGIRSQVHLGESICHWLSQGSRSQSRLSFSNQLKASKYTADNTSSNNVSQAQKKPMRFGSHVPSRIPRTNKIRIPSNIDRIVWRNIRHNYNHSDYAKYSSIQKGDMNLYIDYHQNPTLSNITKFK